MSSPNYIFRYINLALLLCNIISTQYCVPHIFSDMI